MNCHVAILLAGMVFTALNATAMSAEPDIWVRAKIFGGRASVEVPPQYTAGDRGSLDHLQEQFSGRDGFYVDGLGVECPACAPAADEQHLDYGTADTKAYFWVLEEALDATAFTNMVCPEGRDFVVRGKGLHVVYNDPKSGIRYCGGYFGELVFAVCRHIEQRQVCVFGVSYIQLLELVRSDQVGKLDKSVLSSAETAWKALLHPAANGDVIERVLRSFRYE